MRQSHADKDWEEFGATDPYFAVITFEQYRQRNLTEANKKAFFETGDIHIGEVLAKVRKHLAPDFNPRRALDYGCGVGRVLVPLAKLSGSVTGVDVSASMLMEAGRNCENLSIGNVELVEARDARQRLTGKYDFIHSFIVFQHIDVRQGARILEFLLQLLARDGVCVLHFTYADSVDSLRKVSRFIKRHVPFARPLIELARGRRPWAPAMQMNSYDLNAVLRTIQGAGVRDFFAEFTNHGGHLGLLLYFRAPPEARE
jgi:SAM-dependent methyltransferase